MSRAQITPAATRADQPATDTPRQAAPTRAASPRVLIVIVSYRVTELTIDCLRSLEAELRAAPGFHVAVCENGTGGDAPRRLAAAVAENGWDAWCTVSEVFPNRGFCGGNNVVLREWLSRPEPPEFYILLNADTIVRPGAMGALAEFMDAHPTVGIAGSRCEDRDGSPQVSAFRFQTALSELERGMKLGIVTRMLRRWVVPQPIPAGPISTDWVSGASMIIRRRVLEQVGLLDEGYYTYFDDIDLCFRARRSGWDVWHLPASRVVHLGGQSTGVDQRNCRPKRVPPYYHLARRRFFLKSYGRLHAALVDAAFILGFATWRLRRLIQRKPDNDPPKLLWDSLVYSVFCTGFDVRDVPNPAANAMEPQRHRDTENAQRARDRELR
ncbi:N-acetylglucosaminyl-diphospho-decaprenol L-rhamnosyltransferase [Phycisphaerae bacterium RAS1]|nr:N-acetylglucosaminyl-diphospho-decaprenol L-rhamnosyltransferase [Phycisphaerae bacterium RAS1]